MSTQALIKGCTVQRLLTVTEAQAHGLAELLIDCVAGWKPITGQRAQRIPGASCWEEAITSRLSKALPAPHLRIRFWPYS